MRNAGSKTKVEAVVTLAVMLLLMPIIARAGNLEPSGPPTSGTMHSLEDIYKKLSEIDTNIKILMGKEGVGPRFLDNNNGTVTDLRTGLVWLKNANWTGARNWNDAKQYCEFLASGSAGLTDGSEQGDWRLPTRGELQGLGTTPPATWNYGFPSVPWKKPALPFMNVQSTYWSVTQEMYPPLVTCYVNMNSGESLEATNSALLFYVWPVRGSGWK
jgi:hypothetical protein